MTTAASKVSHQWSSSTSDNSAYSVSDFAVNISKQKTSHGWHATVHNQNVSCGGSNSQSNDCGFNTVDGSSCELDGTFDDGRCHWHTEEQCYFIKPDGTPCELSGAYGDDNRCHIHTRGCNESLTHTALEKACFHGMKFPFRMLGLHPDTKYSSGPFDIQPQMAAEVAARVGKTYLETLGDEYDREESHQYYLENIVEDVVDDQSVIDKIKSEFDFLDNGVDLEIFKKGIEQAWKQINKKEHHSDGARTAIAAAEHFLGIEVEVN